MKAACALGALILVIAATFLQPCAPAPPQGTVVKIVMESAVIVWDSTRKIEHFIRSATFESDASNFGFLVPTPTKPDLSEVTGGSSSIAESFTRPKVIEIDKHGIRPVLLVGAFFTLRSRGEDARYTKPHIVTSAPPPPVRMLESKQVGGYEAAVLEADNAAALNSWLKEHGYPSSEPLKEWFEPYIEAKWKITAFKISGSGTTSPVKMSFSADRLFFPYREPKSQTSSQADPRLLKVFILSDARIEGKLGDGSAWPGTLEWADRLASKDQSALLKTLNLQDAQLPGNLWMNYFIDASSPRPGHDDLFFQRSADQKPRIPPPVIIENDLRIPVPLDLVLVVGIVIAAIVIRRRR